MAIMKMSWEPTEEDKEYYNTKKASTTISDEADVDEMFQAWKEWMSYLGYYMDSFSLIRETKNEF